MNETRRKQELYLFFTTIFLFGIGASIVESTLNNYLNTSFHLNGFDRSLVEFPRELPGFLTAFVSALLFFMFTRRLAALTFLLQAVGIFLIGVMSVNFPTAMIWLFIYSLGQHMFMPLNSSIAMELAKDGEAGKKLGQTNGLRNLAAILGSALVFIGFKFLNMDFRAAFIIASILFIICAFILLKMDRGERHPSKEHLKLYPQYKLYYWLCILFGTRKQIFLTFAPWVLVTVFDKPTQTLAFLLTAGAVIGVVYQPWLGKTIDRIGEQKILSLEAALLIIVCAGYGFSGSLFSKDIGFIICAGCFIADQMLMSVSMARSTYLKKIAVDPSHVKPTLSMAITLDHIFSIGIAVFGGTIWAAFGYEWVFLCGAVIAVINLISLRYMKIPVK